jgi:IclR family pca regulon transcriptional regulator
MLTPEEIVSEDRPRSADFVQSLERGLLVIRAFDAEHRELGLSEVARISGLTRAAARRFLLTLAKLGYVTFNDGRFSLTPRVLELGYAYLSSLSRSMSHRRSRCSMTPRWSTWPACRRAGS